MVSFYNKQKFFLIPSVRFLLKKYHRQVPLKTPFLFPLKSLPGNAALGFISLPNGKLLFGKLLFGKLEKLF